MIRTASVNGGRKRPRYPSIEADPEEVPEKKTQVGKGIFGSLGSMIFGGSK